jgi:hypothetical protein
VDYQHRTPTWPINSGFRGGRVVRPHWMTERSPVAWILSQFIKLLNIHGGNSGLANSVALNPLK